MIINDFIRKYNSAPDKKVFCEKHIIEKYVPYEEKIVICKNVTNASSYVTVNDEKKYFKNSPLHHVLFNMSLINRYYPIDINFGEGLMVDFNTLNENGVLLNMIRCIPESEYMEFNMLDSMIADDIYDNERNIDAIISNKLDALSLFINRLDIDSGDANE